MTEQDRPGFAEMMVGLSETYDTPVSEARMTLYWQALADLPLAAVRSAATAHVRASKFFPRPAELREAVDGSHEDRADLAWLELLREVRRVGWCGVPTWTDPVLKATALGMFRDWRDLCETMPGDGPALLGMMKQFKATYAAYARREQRDLLLPPSRDEARQALGRLGAELAKRELPGPGLPS